MAGVAEHGVRLAALEQHHLGALQLAPGEIGIGLATGQDEAVHLVHLGEVHRRRDEALVPRPEGMATLRLPPLGLTVPPTADGDAASGTPTPYRRRPVFPP